MLGSAGKNETVAIVVPDDEKTMECGASLAEDAWTVPSRVAITAAAVASPSSSSSSRDGVGAAWSGIRGCARGWPRTLSSATMEEEDEDEDIDDIDDVAFPPSYRRTNCLGEEGPSSTPTSTPTLTRMTTTTSATTLAVAAGRRHRRRRRRRTQACLSRWCTAIRRHRSDRSVPSRITYGGFPCPVMPIPTP